jgi:hypothetical protein
VTFVGDLLRPFDSLLDFLSCAIRIRITRIPASFLATDFVAATAGIQSVSLNYPVGRVLKSGKTSHIVYVSMRKSETARASGGKAT